MLDNFVARFPKETYKNSKQKCFFKVIYKEEVEYQNEFLEFSTLKLIIQSFSERKTVKNVKKIPTIAIKISLFQDFVFKFKKKQSFCFAFYMLKKCSVDE